ncbi:adenylate kinase 7-like [Halichoeres trimaculatus]|uniref:adenylate kinase 7-like n=1 Tax=Halichoeres trimaculatus TaxID=147232 RepID=UPI003D9E6834
MEDNKQQTRPKRIFINDVHRYSSKHIAKFLSTCVTGETPEEEEAEDTLESPRDEPAFIIVGTVSADSKEEKLSFLHEQYTSPTQDELLQCLLECDVVVYNISEADSRQQIEEATWALTALQAEMENFESQKMFILVSTVMTWAMTKLPNPDETDVLTEESYIRRRPHLSFRNHHNLEKLVLKLKGGKKSKLRGYVVGSGHQYGKGENLFHFYFKVSWLMQFPKVPLFGQGTNCIPMIHINDLGGVIQNIIEAKPKIKPKYILAVDDSKNTLEDIVMMISETLGSGKINILPEDEAIAMKAFTPEQLQFLSINLRLDASIIRDSFSLHWTSERGILENILSVVKEYKDTRQLLPIRICLVGPPAVGKTTLAKKLRSYYQIHHIKIKEVIEEKLTQLEEIVNGAEHEAEEVAAAAQKQLDTLRKSMEMNEGRLADQLVFDMLREKLLSNPCRNQGFVLDGFPKMYKEARLIFSEEATEDQGSVTQIPAYDKEIIPEHVFALNASDDFLTKRAQQLPQREAEEIQYTQEEFTARLKKYRELNAAEETLLDYFDEIEIHPEHIEITAGDPEYKAAMKKIIEIVGTPKNYGLSPEEQEEEDRKKEEVRRQRLAAEAAEKKQRNEAALAEMAAQYEEWQKNLCELKRQEQELLEARCLPLRNYLMKYVMPSLTEAMLECSKIKPEDPVDFLAEHLLRNNHREQQ